MPKITTHTKNITLKSNFKDSYHVTYFNLYFFCNCLFVSLEVILIRKKKKLIILA